MRTKRQLRQTMMTTSPSDYSLSIGSMVWSYSRITQFEQCPYAWLSKYIYEIPKEEKFFSSYGEFIHEIIAQILNGDILKEDAADFYLTNYETSVKHDAPSRKIAQTYYEDGLRYLDSFEFPISRVFEVESIRYFNVRGRRFVGIVDASGWDDNGDFCVLDNKSRTLRPRSSRKTPTKSDKELDDYLRQLYIYSEAYIADGLTPKWLIFNCFRNEEVIKEPWCEETHNRVLDWAEDRMNTIEYNTSWQPCPDYWKCRHLCDVAYDCCYIGGGT